MSSDYEDLIAGLEAAAVAHDTRDPAAQKVAQELLQQSRLLVDSFAERPNRLADLLSTVPSQASEIKIQGLRAIHYLRGSGMGLGYCVRVDLPGVLPALLMQSHLRPPPSDGTPPGRSRRFNVPALDRRLRVHTRAPDLVTVFAVERLADTLPRTGVRIALVPDSERLTVLEFDFIVGSAKRVDAVSQVVLPFTAICKQLIDRQASFLEREVVERAAVEGLEELLEQLSQAASWLSGPVARVGDGIEARLALDEQMDLASNLRVDLTANEKAVLTFTGPLQSPPQKRTELSPQEGFLDALRGAFDTKVDAEPFDSLWLVDGEADVARLLSRCEPELSRLRDLDAVIRMGPDGLSVQLPPFRWEERTVIDAVAATLSLWRAVIRRHHGLADT